MVSAFAVPVATVLASAVPVEPVALVSTVPVVIPIMTTTVTACEDCRDPHIPSFSSPGRSPPSQEDNECTRDEQPTAHVGGRWRARARDMQAAVLSTGRAVVSSTAGRVHRAAGLRRALPEREPWWRSPRRRFASTVTYLWSYVASVSMPLFALGERSVTAVKNDLGGRSGRRDS